MTSTATRGPSRSAADRLEAALRVAVTVAGVVGVILVVVSIVTGIGGGGGGGGHMHRAYDNDPRVREANARDMRAFWRGLTDRTARRIYLLAARPVLLIALAAWITAEYGLWAGAAFVGAFALAMFVYLLATPGATSAAGEPESAESGALPIRDAGRVPVPPDVPAEATSCDPTAPPAVASPHLP